MSKIPPSNTETEFYSELLRAYFDSANDGIFVLCDEMKFLTCNKKIQNWLGITEDQLTLHNQRRAITELLGNNHAAELFRLYFPQALLGKEVCFETQIKPEQGTQRWVEISMTRVNMETGNMVIAIARDISERKKHLATIEYQTYYDSLTDLPNSKYLNKQLAQIENSNPEDHQKISIITIDLNRFKDINESLGQQTGDNILQEIANRLSRLVDITNHEILARLTGDKFALLLPATNLIKASAIAETIKNIVARPIQINGDSSITLHCSAGIAAYPEHTTDISKLIHMAQAAMHSAKTHKLGIAIYDKSHLHTSGEHLRMISDLREAIKNNELNIEYQPIIQLNEPFNIRVEALARWESQNYGHVSPETFILLAEETDLIHDLTLQIIKKSLEECERLLRFQKLSSLSINMSAYCLGKQHLTQEIKHLLSSHKINAQKIIFEMTESAMMSDITMALNNVQLLNQLGVKMAIDDFGTGHSSLFKLKQLPLSELKIDKMFVSDINKNKDDLAITKATIQMAHSLELEVTAEGIEDRETFNILKQLDCDYAQGFWISKPLPINDLYSWLENFDISMLDFRK